MASDMSFLRGGLAFIFLAITTFTMADDPAKTIDDALKRLAFVTELADAKLLEAEKARNKTVSDMKAEAVGWLVDIARGQAGSGEIAEASKTYEAVLRLDEENATAKKFFEAIGRWDVIERKLSRAKRGHGELPREPEALPPKRALQRVEFRCEDGRVFKKMPNGLWHDHGPDGNNYKIEIYRDATGVLIGTSKDRSLHWILPTAFLYQPKPAETWTMGGSGSWIR